MERYHITVGAKTTANGTVRTGCTNCSINGMDQAREGDEVYCPTCETIGVIVCDGPRLVDTTNGLNFALEGDLCYCKCAPRPRLIANQTLSSQIIEDTPQPQATLVHESGHFRSWKLPAIHGIPRGRVG